MKRETAGYYCQPFESPDLHTCFFCLIGSLYFLLLHSARCCHHRHSLMTSSIHVAKPFRVQYYTCNCRWSKVVVCYGRVHPEFYLVINYMDIYPLTFSTVPCSSVIVNVPLTVVALGPSWSTAVWTKSDTS